MMSVPEWCRLLDQREYEEKRRQFEGKGGVAMGRGAAAHEALRTRAKLTTHDKCVTRREVGTREKKRKKKKKK